MDNDGYPDDDELKTIREWSPSERGFEELIPYIQARWNWKTTMFKVRKGKTTFGKPCLKIRCSTGGWSGNESLIAAMNDNFTFWSYCWVSSRRGGHYEFEVRIG